jgi:ATP-dependent helicase HrpB
LVNSNSINSDSGNSASTLTHEAETALLISILAGYPDRVARRRTPPTSERRDNTEELLLSGGGAAELAAESVVRRAEFLVAVEAAERRERGRAASRGGVRTLVRLASAIEPEWLLDLFPAQVREATEARWHEQAERVEAVSRLLYDNLVLTETRASSNDNEEIARVLCAAARAAGWRSFADVETVERLLARVEFMARTFPEAEFPALADETVETGLEQLCAGRRSFAELRAAVAAGELLDKLRQQLTHEQTRLLAASAPERVTLAGGRQVRVNYERGRAPWIASRLQDFFGLREGPRIAQGRVALVLHLLAPNQRPVQVTTDLASFWARQYPQVRRELSRRYPRHAWPEDPLGRKLS